MPIWMLELPRYSNSLRFALQPAVFGLQAILRQMYRMTEKWPWTLKGKGTPYVSQLTTVGTQISRCFALPLSSYRPFWDKCIAKMTLKGQRYKIYIVSYIVSLHANAFELQATLRKRGPNDPKITVNTQRSINGPIYITTTPAYQISLRFALRWTVFELQVILRQVHRMTPKWKVTLNNKRSKAPYIHVTTIPESQISPSFAPRSDISEILAIFIFPLSKMLTFFISLNLEFQNSKK